MAAATFVSSSQTASYSESGTYRRLSAAQVCPVLMKAPQKSPSAIAAGSASSRTMPASLPPSSTVTRFTESAEARMIALPVTVDPVNMSLSTPGCEDSASPTSRPPGTAIRTSWGSAVFSTCARATTESGVYSLGLITTVFPMRRAGASCQTEIIIGQFHGPMAPTTPSGRWWISA